MKSDFNNQNFQSHYILLPINARDDTNNGWQHPTAETSVVIESSLCALGIGTSRLISDFWEDKDGAYIDCLSLLHIKF